MALYFGAELTKTHSFLFFWRFCPLGLFGLSDYFRTIIYLSISS